MDEDPTSNPPGIIRSERAGDKDSKTIPLSALSRGVDSLHGKMQYETPARPRESGHQIPPSAAHDATPVRDTSPTGFQSQRDRNMGVSAGKTLAAGYSASATSDHPHPPSSTDHQAPQLPQLLPQQQPTLTRSDSQESNATDTADRVFTPPASGGGMSPGTGSGSGQHSSQESQLLQLSQIAAAQERAPEGTMDGNGNGGASRKRMADGVVKHKRDNSAASPVQIHVGGHSRNTSTVSVASTAGSRVGESTAVGNRTPSIR